MNLPGDFADRMRSQLGQENYHRFEATLSEVPPVSIRINKKKFDPVLMLDRVPWCDSGYYLAERPVFVSDPLWHAGAYYVQEASSMMIEQAFLEAKSRITGPVKVLDLCAAPGGKSTHLASMLGAEDVLVSNEVIRSRVPVLIENLLKHGYPNTIITCADSSDFQDLGEIFDIILVDAPCSGEGLFRKDPQAVSEWNPENIQTCELRQKRILEAIQKCLKPGGFLIYSTCTYNPGENSEQVDKLVSQGLEPVPFSLNGQVNYQFQAYPHECRGEGFYLSLLRKNHSSGIIPRISRKHSLKPLRSNDKIKSFITRSDAFYEFEDQVLSISEEVMEFYRLYISNLHCQAIGTKVCTIKDKRLSPSEYLPFSQILNRSQMPEIGLEQSAALSYLANQTLPFSGSEKGYVLLSYQNVAIGLGKFAGNRINNLFPNAWRLRKQISQHEWFSLLK